MYVHELLRAMHELLLQERLSPNAYVWVRAAGKTSSPTQVTNDGRGHFYIDLAGNIGFDVDEEEEEEEE